MHTSLVRETKARFNANGTTNSDFTGTGAEVALRHQF
jgi:hypothetical protein